MIIFIGLIDEIFGINHCTASFPIDNFLSTEERTSESLSEDKKQIILNSADKLFMDVRDKNFNAVNYLKVAVDLMNVNFLLLGGTLPFKTSQSH